MPKFLALITGTGEGCDYTIGCNKTWKVKEAENKEAFIKDILNDFGMLSFDKTSYPDILIEKLEVIEVETIEVIEGIPEWYDQQWNLAKEQKKEDEERKLFEELKAKYGDK